ncbi:excinuclease ABC subunit C [Candidatus Nanohalococcus occultus]|uniref:Excinuclease ABC subunit C, UV-specific endonuclease n=1 Tax=Candidatus Nanohalococcus occultus TaxID=2978047 RepID=A0ABY8CJC9_9ARCH|nr:Excinuclease ABC subunit C, UV-specific endonuclease [Candidatus Nanohaloarchaeota archaeon SVXNc]
MRSEDLDSVIEDKPSEPGVYIFREGEVPIYIGKAVEIKDRLKSYKDPRTPRIGKMVQRADEIDYRTTDDEKEALLLEANLIKKFQPKYNIRLKDSKSYPVIQITDHEYPAIEATRDPDEEATVFGPFTEMGRVENAIKAIRDLYGIRGCSDRKFAGRDRPCLDYQMGICSAPCVGYVERDEYIEQVRKAKEFFRSDSSKLLERITRKMNQAAEEKRFERAGTLRDYRDDLENLRGNKNFRDTGIKHVLAVNQGLDRIGMVLLEKNTIKDKRFYRLNEQAESSLEALEAFIKQFYASDSLPERIVTEKQINDSEILEWLETEGVSTGEPEDGRERILMESAAEASKMSENLKMSKLGETLGIDLERMECFDVSHTGGTDVVGSNVVFVDDEPVKSDYRRKKLVEENDDYENMYRLVKWRAKLAKEGRDDREDPDLVLIDGGKGQLKAASRAMKDVGWSKPVLGIVKPEDEILGSRKNPGINDETRQVLSAIRDEAHRFAINYHISRRDSIDSVLEEIDGLGPETRKKLMKRFTLEDLEKASRADLKTVDGIGDRLADRIKQLFD